MKRRTKLILVVSALLISLFGTTMIVNAEELENVIENSEQIYYEPQEADENGLYTYKVYCGQTSNPRGGNIQQDYQSFTSTYKIAFYINHLSETMIVYTPVIYNNNRVVSVRANDGLISNYTGLAYIYSNKGEFIKSEERTSFNGSIGATCMIEDEPYLYSNIALFETKEQAEI